MAEIYLLMHCLGDVELGLRKVDHFCCALDCIVNVANLVLGWAVEGACSEIVHNSLKLMR